MVHCGCMAVPARMAGIRAASRTLDAIEYSLVQSKNANSVIGIHTASRVCRVKRRRTGVREYKGQHAGPTTGRRANPRRFWSLTVQRTCPFWFPYRDVFTPASGYSVCLITFVSLLGLFDLLRDAKAIGWLLFVVSLLCSGLYSFLQADMCYRYPILWLSLLCAGYFAARAIHPRWERQYKRLRTAGVL